MGKKNVFSASYWLKVVSGIITKFGIVCDDHDNDTCDGDEYSNDSDDDDDDDDDDAIKRYNTSWRAETLEVGGSDNKSFEFRIYITI